MLMPGSDVDLPYNTLSYDRYYPDFNGECLSFAKAIVRPKALTDTTP
jgi:hypothetical protein